MHKGSISVARVVHNGITTTVRANISTGAVHFASGNYTWVQFVGRQPTLISKTLAYFEEMLGEAGFVRTHKSQLVNFKHVRSFDQKFKYLILSDGTKAKVSRRRKLAVEKLLNAGVY